MTPIRRAAILALVALLLPAELSAQRLPVPRIGRRGPAKPAPLPPQAEPIARQLAYRRIRLSVESYPMITYIQDGVLSDWASFGMGTRADYRVAPNVGITLDFTSAFAGGPANVYTMELGTRLRPDRMESRLYPFLDFRVGHARAYSGGYIDVTGGGFGPPTVDEAGFQYSSGFGAVAGAGAEYWLTRTLSLTTAASIMRNRMTTTTLVGADQGERSYNLTLYRYTLGIRYNPVRVIQVPGSDLR
jgi:hypothetical protein